MFEGLCDPNPDGWSDIETLTKGIAQRAMSAISQEPLCVPRDSPSTTGQDGGRVDPLRQTLACLVTENLN